MKRLILVGALLAGTIPIIGCGVKASSPAAPPTLNNVYSKAATGMQNFSADVAQAQQIEISLYKGGLPGLDQPTHKSIQNGFLQVGIYGKQIDALISGQAGAATVQAKVNQALASLGAITAATGNLSPDAVAQLNATIGLLTQILNSVIVTLNTNTISESRGEPMYPIAISMKPWPASAVYVGGN